MHSFTMSSTMSSSNTLGRDVSSHYRTYFLWWGVTGTIVGILLTISEEINLRLSVSKEVVRVGQFHDGVLI